MNKFMIGFVSLALYTAVGGWFIYAAGKNAEKASNIDVVNAYQVKQRKLVSELEKEKDKREVRYETKTKIIKIAADPTGCKRMPAPVDIVRQFKTRSAP
jgi:hypothetical protein